MALNPNHPTPLYVQIKELLQHQIESGVFAIGDRLPSERELAEQHNVSRMTARQALQLLQQNGYSRSQVGKGTFVHRPEIDQELRELTSFTRDMIQRGMRPASRVLLAAIRPADDDMAAQLQTEIGDAIVVLRRVRLADNRPIAIETAHLRSARFPGLLDHDFAEESLYRVLKEHFGVRLVWATQIIGARMPERAEREALGVGARVPVLSLVRVTYDENDRPVEYVRSCYHSERYQLRTTLREIG